MGSLRRTAQYSYLSIICHRFTKVSWGSADQVLPMRVQWKSPLTEALERLASDAGNIQGYKGTKVQGYKGAFPLVQSIPKN